MNIQEIYEIQGITFKITIEECFNHKAIIEITDKFLYGLYNKVDSNIKAEYEITMTRKNQGFRVLHSESGNKAENMKYLGFNVRIKNIESEDICYVEFLDLKMKAVYNRAFKQLEIQCFEDNEWVDFYIGWMIRELIRTNSLSRGKIFIHSAAIELDNNGLLICGGKGSGKTSSLMEMLGKGCGFIANDQVIIDVDNKDIKILGFPMFVGIGIGTLSRFPIFNKWINDYSNLVISQYKLVRHQNDIENSFKDEKKLLLVVNELLSKFTKSKFTRSSKMTAIIKVEFDENIKNAVIVEIKEKYKKEEILQDNMNFKNDNVFNDIFCNITIDIQSQKKIYEQMLEKIKFYELKQNLECVGTYQSLKDVLREMG